MGLVEGNTPVSDNDWETVTQDGDSEIRKWIDDQMSGRSCVIVLIGSRTSGRKWIKYEIEKAWNDGKGLLGIHIHNLKDQNENQASEGSNPFYSVIVNGKRLSSMVSVYDPPYKLSANVYDYIAKHIADWVEDAIGS